MRYPFVEIPSLQKRNMSTHLQLQDCSKLFCLVGTIRISLHCFNAFCYRIILVPILGSNNSIITVVYWPGIFFSEGQKVSVWIHNIFRQVIKTWMLYLPSYRKMESPRLIDGRINLDAPRYDQSTFLGRAKHFFTITDPRNILRTAKELDEAKDILIKYRYNEKQTGIRTKLQYC